MSNNQVALVKKDEDNEAVELQAFTRIVHIGMEGLHVVQDSVLHRVAEEYLRNMFIYYPTQGLPDYMIPNFVRSMRQVTSRYYDRVAKGQPEQLCGMTFENIVFVIVRIEKELQRRNATTRKRFFIQEADKVMDVFTVRLSGQFGELARVHEGENEIKKFYASVTFVKNEIAGAATTALGNLQSLRTQLGREFTLTNRPSELFTSLVETEQKIENYAKDLETKNTTRYRAIDRQIRKSVGPDFTGICEGVLRSVLNKDHCWSPNETLKTTLFKVKEFYLNYIPTMLRNYCANDSSQLKQKYTALLDETSGVLFHSIFTKHADILNKPIMKSQVLPCHDEKAKIQVPPANSPNGMMMVVPSLYPNDGPDNYVCVFNGPDFAPAQKNNEANQ